MRWWERSGLRLENSVRWRECWSTDESFPKYGVSTDLNYDFFNISSNKIIISSFSRSKCAPSPASPCLYCPPYPPPNWSPSTFFYGSGGPSWGPWDSTRPAGLFCRLSCRKVGFSVFGRRIRFFWGRNLCGRLWWVGRSRCKNWTCLYYRLKIVLFKSNAIVLVPPALILPYLLGFLAGMQP